MLYELKIIDMTFYHTFYLKDSFISFIKI